jgi:phosphohistidine phosphatase
MSDRFLVLVRHAKAERPDGVADIQRPLTPRGHADAAAAGVWLAHRRVAPNVVLCSPAKRTRQTWHGIALGMAEGAGSGNATEAGGGAVVRYDPALYTGDVQDLLELVRGVDEKAGTVLLVGHNPAISLLSAALDPAGESSTDGLRTCGIAVHRPFGSWLECGSGTAPLETAHTARG